MQGFNFTAHFKLFQGSRFKELYESQGKIAYAKLQLEKLFVRKVIKQ